MTIITLVRTVWSSGVRPSPPSNVSVWQTDRPHAVHISWQRPTYSAVTVAGYVVEYRTVGQWVPLTDRLPAYRNEYRWTTASRGATYRFRVRSISSTGVRSEPARTVSFQTSGKPTNRFYPRDAMHSAVFATATCPVRPSVCHSRYCI